MTTVRASVLGTALICLSLACPTFAQTLINVASDKTDPRDLRDTEPSIAVNPRNPQEIAIVTFSESWSPSEGAPVWKSVDGGATWTKVRVLMRPPSLRNGPGDQAVAYDSNGRLFVAEMDIPGATGTAAFVYIYRETGSGLVPGTAFGDDQPQISVDRSTTGPCKNRIYSPWLNIRNQITQNLPAESMVTYSNDDGLTVTTSKANNTPGEKNRTTRLAIAPNGKAYIMFKSHSTSGTDRFQSTSFKVVRSDDCGTTWGALGVAGVSVHGPGNVMSWFTSSFGNPSKGKVSRARSSDGWIAVDPSDGDVYVAYVNKDESGFGQIFVARSTDEGETWVSHRVTDGQHNSAFPEIAVAANGSIGLLFIDYDDSQANTIFRHRFAQSFDDGVNFTNTILQSMNPNVIENAHSGFIWGDYEGLTAVENTFYGVFTGQSLPGTRTKVQLDPIFFKVPAVPGGAKLRKDEDSRRTFTMRDGYYLGSKTKSRRQKVLPYRGSAT
jgi:hypothetical protein